MKWNPMNMFGSKTNQDLLRSAETQKELAELKRIGREMLSDPRYAKYKEQLDAVLGRVIKELLDYNHPDNNVYAVNVRTMIQQLKDLLAILNTPVSFLNYIAMTEMKLQTETERGEYARNRT